MLRIDGYTVTEAERVDVRAGRCSYGDMTSLGRAMDKAHETGVGVADLIRALLGVLHPGVNAAINADNLRYALSIAEGVRFWREQEAEKLKYTPTDDERRAGYDALAATTGPTGVASTLAEKFGVHGGPDEIFTWPYATVFMVLRIDLERSKFNRRLQELRDNRRQREERRRRR